MILTVMPLAFAAMTISRRGRRLPALRVVGGFEAIAVGAVRTMAEAEPQTFPANVAVSEEARRILDRSSDRLLSFSAPEGRTLHAGLGGPYDRLRFACPMGRTECRFFIDAANRWDSASDIRHDDHCFLPAGRIFLFGVTLSAVGWVEGRVTP